MKGKFKRWKWNVKIYYENGKLLSKGQYENFKETGEWIEYNENWTIHSKWNYENGERTWIWIFYNEKWKEEDRKNYTKAVTYTL
jgi:antitoxin component YwqK of YwqJK toxin-antitoxin module